MLSRLCLLIGAASAVLGMVVQPVHKLPTAHIAMRQQPLMSTGSVQPLVTHNTAIADEPRFRVLPSGEVMALEGESTTAQAGHTEPTAIPEHSAAKAGAGTSEKCDEGKEYSAIFKKCLPRVGTDGYTPRSGAAAGDKKGKLIGDTRIFQDPQQIAALHVEPLRVQPLSSPHIAGQQQQQQQQQQVPLQQQHQSAQQLRLACPSGFVYQPNMGTCIAFSPTSALAAGRGGSDDGDDDDDDNDGDRTGALSGREGRGDDDERRSQLFGRRRFMFHRDDDRPFFSHRHHFGSGMRSFRPRYMGSFRGEPPSILAPVFVFVLPPTSMEGRGGQRIHRIHPSFVGPADKKADATAAIPKGKTMETKPAQPPTTSTTEPASKTEDKAKATPTATPSAPTTPSDTTAPATTTTPGRSIESKPSVVTPAALRNAEFISPIVSGGDMSAVSFATSPTATEEEKPAKLSETVSSDQML